MNPHVVDEHERLIASESRQRHDVSVALVQSVDMSARVTSTAQYEIMKALPEDGRLIHHIMPGAATGTVVAAEIRADDAGLGYSSGAARAVVKRMAPHGCCLTLRPPSALPPPLSPHIHTLKLPLHNVPFPNRRPKTSRTAGSEPETAVSGPADFWPWSSDHLTIRKDVLKSVNLQRQA